MPSRAASQEEIDALALLGEVTLDFEADPEHIPRLAREVPWEPELNPTQKLIFNDATSFILAYGEKGSGKSVGVEHKLVRHCYENEDALAVIITPSIRTGKFGVIHDLETLVLPAWEEGIGLEWTKSRLDPSTKDRVLKVANRFGGWSTILQIAIPFAEAIPSRLKGIHPSFIMLDEATDCNGREYFSMVAAQLNRRRHITGPQQYCATCNPKGPSNWVYQEFIEGPVDKTTGVQDPRFAVYHVPFSENAHRPEVKSYIETLTLAVKNDPIEKARLIDGVWIERPTGAALFREHFIEERHVVGDILRGTGLTPIKGWPCVVGYDLGQVYSAAAFLQYVVFPSGPKWLQFDEIAHLREKILYKRMAMEIADRMLAWNKFLGSNLIWEHVTDDSAVNQWRPGGSGSYDAWEFEKEFNLASITHGWPQMRMVGCPKGAGSVEARVRLLQAKLTTDQYVVSTYCTHAKAMLNSLEGEKDDPLKPRKTVAGHIHVFDSITYPILKLELAPGFLQTSGPAVRLVRSGA